MYRYILGIGQIHVQIQFWYRSIFGIFGTFLVYVQFMYRYILGIDPIHTQVHFRYMSNTCSRTFRYKYRYRYISRLFMYNVPIHGQMAGYSSTAPCANTWANIYVQCHNKKE